jgi:hypothetical protein
LLHYTFEKLANILTLITYREPYSRSHGIRYYEGQPIEILRKGLFTIFHDSYSDDPSIYLENCEFILEDVVDAER